MVNEMKRGTPNAKQPESRRALESAVRAAQAAGEIMRKNLHAEKRVTESSLHDIKLELDIRCQKRIERLLRQTHPEIPILGEEGTLGDPEAAARWVVDPIDGTVNFTYGIPHACVSVALQTRAESQSPGPNRRNGAVWDETFKSVVGVVYDPFCDELWTAVRGQPARLNGRRIQASRRRRLNEAIVSFGFSKKAKTTKRMLPTVNRLIHRVRKVRVMGAAALSLVYVATGRMDAYLESGLRLWDIAAGGLIIECAGGRFLATPLTAPYTYEVNASNGVLPVAIV
jgi:myo-inositol-1(or 4)-monophosphatase